MLKYIVYVLFLAYVAAKGKNAVVRIEGYGSGVSGIIKFTQLETGVLLRVSLKGLKPGTHDYHVHENGDLSDRCDSIGGHLKLRKRRSHKKVISKREIPKIIQPKEITSRGLEWIRRPGDFGHFIVDETGFATFSVIDERISLTGRNSIVGHAVVIHKRDEDLEFNPKLAHNANPQKIACGVIGLA